MTDGIKVELDSSPLVQGAKEFEGAARSLMKAIDALDKSNVQNLKGQIKALTQAIKTSGVEMAMISGEMVKAAEGAAKQIDAALAKGVKDGIKHAQAEADKSVINATMKVNTIPFADGTKVNLGTKGLGNTEELLKRQAEVLALPGAIDPNKRAAQENELRDLERFGKERAAADALRISQVARQRAAFEKDAAESLRAQSLALQSNELRDLERFGKERAAVLLRSAEMERRARATALTQAASVVVNRASANPGGDFSVLTGVKRGLEVSPEIEKVNAAIRNTSVESAKAGLATKGFAGEMRELHSGVRGLASGFGAMWLTWGSILPLMAGAAVSGAAVQIVKLGAQVSDTMERMRILGAASSESVAGLNTQMLELSRTGPFGPKEIAEAMKTLKLAGQDVVDVSKSIKDVLNFSVAGDVGIQAAADAMTTVATAFGITANGFGYIGDTISKAAAESKSSIEDMANAFKTASVINQQYGVTLEDTAVGLALLANAGIKGTAAGTALRNTYAELSGRTGKAQQALTELGVKALDPLTGKMKETGIIFRELMQALQKGYTPEGSLHVLQRIFDERGAKSAFAIFDALSRKAKDAGTDVATVYDELVYKVTNAAGFAAIAAAEVSLTPLNQMKAVAASFQATLVETFEKAQPYILEVSARLREAVGSDQFKSLLQSLVTVVGGITTVVVEHGRVLGSVLLAYGGWKAATLLVTSTAAAFGVLGGAAGVATGAVTALGIAARVATSVNPLLLALAGLVTTAASAWAIYEMWVGKADRAQTEGFSNQAQLIKNLHDEADRLDRINEARSKGITLQELELRAKGKAALSGTDAEVASAKARLESAQGEADLVATRNEGAFRRGSGTPSFDLAARNKQYEVARELASSELGLQRSLAKQDGERRDLQEAKNQVVVRGIRNTLEERAAMKAATDAAASRYTGKRDGLAPDTSGANSAKAMKVLRDNELEMVAKRYQSSMSVISDGESAQQRLLQASLSATIVTQGEFYAKELLLAEQSESKKLSRNKEFRVEYMSGYEKLVKDVNSAFNEAEAANVGKKGADDLTKQNTEARDSQLQNLKQKMEEDLERVNDSDTKIRSAAETRMKLQQISQAGAYAKMTKTSREFWESEALAEERAARDTSLQDRLRSASPEDVARISAVAAETERWTTILQQHDKAILDDQKSLERFMQKVAAFGPVTEEQAALQWDLTTALMAQRAERDKIASQADRKAVDKGESAALKQVKDERDEMTKSVADAITTGLTEGGAAGGKKLRDIVKNELRKRINIQVTAVVDMAFNSLLGGASTGGGGGLLGGLLGKVFGGAASPAPYAGLDEALLPSLGFLQTLPFFAKGTDYVPHDMVAMIHKGEKIVPAAYNKPDADSQRPIVVNQNFTVGDVASVSMVREAVSGSERRIAGRLGRSMQYGGALA